MKVILVAKGGFQFEDNSGIVKKAMDLASQKAMEAATLYVEGQAKALAPVGDSGELRDKINHKVSKKNGNIVGTVGSPMTYAMYVEYGTGEFAENGAGRKGGWNYQDSSGEWFFTWGQDPQPFLRPAFRKNKQQIQSILGNSFKISFKGK